MKQMRDDQWQKLFDSVTNMDPRLVEKTSLTVQEDVPVFVHPKRRAVIKWVLVAVAAITAICALFAISILNDMAWIWWGKQPETSAIVETGSDPGTVSPNTTAPDVTTSTSISTQSPETRAPEAPTVSPIITTVPLPEITAQPPETTAPAPETTVPAPETTVPAPETTIPAPETTVPAPETTVPGDPYDPLEYSQRLLFIESDDRQSYIVSGVTSIGFLDFNMVVPAVYNGLPVTEIGDYAFVSNQTLTTLLIPDSVTRLGDFCFAYSLTLSTITYHGTVAQWNAIEKGMMWNSGSGIKSIVCLDGTVRN